MKLILTIWEDIFVYVLLAWVFYTYGRMYKRHTVTQAEYKWVKIAAYIALVLATLDALRRVFWPYE